MNKKVLILALVVLILGGFAGYTFAKPKKTVKLKVNGDIYVMPKSFTLNMSDGQYATLTVALVLAPGQSAGTGTAGATPPPTGYGGLPEEAIVRNIITNVVTNEPGSGLITSSGRAKTESEILRAINATTDVKVKQVLFPDVAVQ